MLMNSALRSSAQGSQVQRKILQCQNKHAINSEEGFSMMMEGTSAAMDGRRELQGRTCACPRSLHGEARLL